MERVDPSILTIKILEQEKEIKMAQFILEISENKEISIYFVMNRIRQNRNKVGVGNVFAYNTTLNMMSGDEDFEPKSCRQSYIWPKLETPIKEELNSFCKQIFLDLNS